MPTRESGLPTPCGWYTAAFSDALRSGDILNRRFAGHDVIIYRTEAGVPVMMDAYCPHLGAHMGHGGQVIGENIRCPFHAFTFDTDGVCVSTGYKSNPPPKAIARTWPVQEVNGLVLAYYHPDGHSPDFEVPALDFDGWTPLLHKSWPLNSHPQETTENSVDLGHLMVVHGYENLAIVDGPDFAGPYMTVTYQMKRPGRGMLPTVETRFKVHIHGLGYSLVELDVLTMGLQARQYVLPSPIADGQITLSIGLSMRRFGNGNRGDGALKWLPNALLNGIMPPILMGGYANDVQQDFDIWQHKAYVSPPILAEGDGPIGKYRHWVKQFYVN